MNLRHGLKSLGLKSLGLKSLARPESSPEASRPASEQPSPPPETTPQEAAHRARDLQRDVIADAFDAPYYLSQNPDIAAAGVDPLYHYLHRGWRENRRPNSWFDANRYLAKNPEIAGEDINPFYHFLANRDRAPELRAAELRAVQSNKLLLLQQLRDGSAAETGTVVISVEMPKGKDLALARKHFDADYYLAQNPDVAEVGVSPFQHFMTIGWLEGRDPAESFSVRYYLHKNPDVRRAQVNPFVHHLKVRDKEKWRSALSAEAGRIMLAFEANPSLQAQVDAAIALDPMVSLPRTTRTYSCPPDTAKVLANAAETIRKALAGRRYSTVVAIPHIRMAGSARVAAIFAEALAQARDPGEILVVTTESTEADYAHWFPAGIARFDLSAKLRGLHDAHRQSCLLDLLRGVGCRTLVNVNSRLAWDSLQAYGRQMSQEFRIATYLFTWDETPEGLRGGYPIQWLRDTCDHHHLLMTDTRNLADYVADRFGYLQNNQGPATGTEVLPLYTPARAPEAEAILAGRNDTPRFLWAGRFDAQKRVDILVEIARSNPDVVFDVYGKTVLEGEGLESFSLPSNINALGTYTDLSEVLATPYHGFLYTAQWDGMPTILLDIAAAGLPIVAPRVGGIAELVNDRTGWLIDDFTDVAAYGEAMTAILRDPADAASRAQAMQAHHTELFDAQTYETSIREAFERHGM